MNRLPSFSSLFASLAVAALIGCASTRDAETPPVIRSAPPQGYENTINSFFAFRIQGPQSNAVIGISSPEPGPCPLGGYAKSSRGWVVPTVYETRTRDASGKGTVNVRTKQYYFWFLGNTIAGISPRMDLCPGAEMTFGDDLPATHVPDGTDAASVAGGPNQEAAKQVKKAGASRAVVRRPVKKEGSASGKTIIEPTK